MSKTNCPRPTDETPTDDAAAETAARKPTSRGRRRGRRSRRRSRYRTQRRGGKGLRDIKTTDRNGPVIGIVSVRDDDELLMMTARGKIQRIAASDISVIGRNTQGVRIMSLDEGDTLAAIVPVPRDEGRTVTAAARTSSRPCGSQPAADIAGRGPAAEATPTSSLECDR